jgi:hypothetical protein
MRQERVYLKDPKSACNRDTCTPMFTTALLIIGVYEKMSENMVLYTLKYYSAIKKNEIMPFARKWM